MADRIDRLTKRLQIVEKVQVVEEKVDHLSTSVSELAASVDRRFEEVDRRFDAVDRAFLEHNARLEAKMDAGLGRMERFERKLDQFIDVQLQTNARVDRQLRER